MRFACIDDEQTPWGPFHVRLKSTANQPLRELTVNSCHFDSMHIQIYVIPHAVDKLITRGIIHQNGLMWTSFSVTGIHQTTATWASYQIRKIVGCACTGNAGNVFPATDFKGNHQLAIPACITARAWRGKHSRHSRRMRNPQFYISGKSPMEIFSCHDVVINMLLSDNLLYRT